MKIKTYHFKKGWRATVINNKAKVKVTCSYEPTKKKAIERVKSFYKLTHPRLNGIENITEIK
jgi:hypothetical protein